MEASEPIIHPKRRSQWGREYVVDVAATCLTLLKFPLALLIAFTAVFFMLFASVDIFTRLVRSGVPSVCDLPPLSSFRLCTSLSAPVETTLSVQSADFPGLVHVQNVALDQLLAKPMAGATDLALNVRHAELAVRDLVAIVRASNLTVKSALAESLNDFALEARNAGRGLQRLGAKIQGAVDSIASFNAYALRAIDAAQERGHGDIQTTVLQTFHASLSGFSSHVARVMVEAADTMSALDMLETRLFTIHELCVHEAFLNAVALDDLLWELWSVLGGNQDRKRDLRHRAAVLKEVEHYRSTALAYVAATAQAVTGIEAQLSELRDRLVERAADSQELPVEVQLASLERIVSRLQEKGIPRSPAIDP